MLPIAWGAIRVPEMAEGWLAGMSPIFTFPLRLQAPGLFQEGGAWTEPGDSALSDRPWRALCSNETFVILSRTDRLIS
jgi:hypothetical protein